MKKYVIIEDMMKSSAPKTGGFSLSAEAGRQFRLLSGGGFPKKIIEGKGI